MKFFTADQHWNHKSILKMDNFYGRDRGWRPFRDVKEMNQTMIDGWNEVVKSGDMVYHLGDFAMPNKGDGHDIGDILEQLNGQIYLIKGNHDDRNMNLYKDWTRKFVKITYLAYLKLLNGQRVMLCHYPMLSWRSSCHGAWHLHGHCHGSLPRRHLAYDVGVDSNDYQPIPETKIPSLIWTYTKKVNVHKVDKGGHF